MKGTKSTDAGLRMKRRPELIGEGAIMRPSHSHGTCKPIYLLFMEV